MEDEKYWQQLKQKYLPHSRGVDLNVARIGAPLQHCTTISLRASLCDLYVQKIGEALSNVRADIGSMLGASRDRIMLSYNTTYALREAMRAVPLGPEFDIVTTTEEYGSMPEVLRQYADLANGTVRAVPAGKDVVKNIRDAITPKTRAVMTAHITHTGELLPVREIADAVHEKGMIYIVDAAQSVGHIPVHVKDVGADLLVGCGHKWLRSQTVSGFAYLDQKLQMPARSIYLPCATAGWSTKQAKEYIDYDGWGNAEAVLHLGQNLRMYTLTGWPKIHQRIATLGEQAYHTLQENRNVELLHHTAGIVTFRIPGQPQREVQQQLEQRGVYLTYKENEDLLRASFSPFNSCKDIERLDNALRKVSLPHRHTRFFSGWKQFLGWRS